MLMEYFVNFLSKAQDFVWSFPTKIQFEIFTHKTELVLYVIGVFVHSIGGTSYKRVHGVLFWRFSTKIKFWFYSLKKELVLYVFGVYVDTIGGGTPDKRFYEGLFWPLLTKIAF